MRYFIIFGITFLIALFIIFYNPYLGKYKNQVTIEYNYNDEGYHWDYDLEGDSLIIDNEEDNKWTFKANKNGSSSIVFKYTNKDNIKYQINYRFKVIGKNILWMDGYGKGLLNFPNPY